jgi:hypothetical protein
MGREEVEGVENSFFLTPNSQLFTDNCSLLTDYANPPLAPRYD